MERKMKPPIGAKIATTLLIEEDFTFMLVGPIDAGRALGAVGVTLAVGAGTTLGFVGVTLGGGAGMGLSAAGDIVWLIVAHKCTFPS